ncbi:MAG: 1-phosphofructokinase, partial [Okeania sp. SIO3C4]|nr:1-phosphofructokinase [Okeania sp. SIO3C4]
ELSDLLKRPLPRVDDVVEAAQELIHSGIKNVAVSMGADGAILCLYGEIIHAKPLSVDVKTTVGAGDAMVAGLTHAITNGQSVEQAARMATAVAAAALGQIGPILPSLTEINELAGQVRIEHLSKN